MKKKLLGLLITVLFFFITQSTTVLAVTPMGPYTYVHCNINISFIESNLCEDESCSPLVKIEYGDQFWIDDSCRIFDVNDDVYVLDIWANLSDNATDLLNQACDPEITPVINYIEENNLTKYSTTDYNDFYPYYPTGENNKEIKQIDETWYLATSSFDPESVTSFYRTMDLIYALMIIIPFLLIMAIVSIIMYRRWKKKNSQ